MPWPPKFRLSLGLFLLLAALPCAAAPPAPAPKTTPAPTASLPDYGGRDAPLSGAEAAGTDVPNPLAQAGRSVEALVIVLVGVIGVLYLLKRMGWVGGNASAMPLPASLSWLKPRQTAPAPAVSVTGSSTSLNVVQSQPLPGTPGASLHLLSVNDQTLLLGATAQGVSLLAQWDNDKQTSSPEAARAEKAAFDDYLQRAGVAPELPPVRAVEERIGATADRLQALLAGSRAHAPEETQR